MNRLSDYSVAYNWDESQRITAHGRIILRKMLRFMANTKKEVRFLTVGDVLSGSGAKVISSPTSGLKTPPGKMEVGVEYANGQKKVQIWNKYTMVGVNTPDVPPASITNTEPIMGVPSQPSERSIESGL